MVVARYLRTSFQNWLALNLRRMANPLAPLTAEPQHTQRPVAWYSGKVQ